MAAREGREGGSDGLHELDLRLVLHRVQLRHAPLPRFALFVQLRLQRPQLNATVFAARPCLWFNLNSREETRKAKKGRARKGEKRKCRSYLSCAWDSGDTVDPRRACGLNHLLQCLQENNLVRKESILSKADEKEKIKNYKNKEERRYLSFDDDDIRTNGHPHVLEHDTHRLHDRRVGASNHLKPTILLHCLNDILI